MVWNAYIYVMRKRFGLVEVNLILIVLLVPSCQKETTETLKNLNNLGKNSGNILNLGQ